MRIIVLNQIDKNEKNVVYSAEDKVTDMVVAREIRELNDNGIIIKDDVLGERLRAKGYEINKVVHSDFLVNIGTKSVA